MSVIELNTIDFITEKEDCVILTISDHLEWDEENEHIWILQEKINLYLSAIESGQVRNKFPQSSGKRIIISVALKYEPNEMGRLFFSKVDEVLSNAGYGFSFYVL